MRLATTYDVSPPSGHVVQAVNPYRSRDYWVGRVSCDGATACLCEDTKLAETFDKGLRQGSVNLKKLPPKWQLQNVFLLEDGRYIVQDYNENAEYKAVAKSARIYQNGKVSPEQISIKKLPSGTYVLVMPGGEELTIPRWGLGETLELKSRQGKTQSVAVLDPIVVKWSLRLVP